MMARSPKAMASLTVTARNPTTFSTRSAKDSGPRLLAMATWCPSGESARAKVPPIRPDPTIPILILHASYWRY